MKATQHGKYDVARRILGVWNVFIGKKIADDPTDRLDETQLKWRIMTLMEIISEKVNSCTHVNSCLLDA